MWKNKSLCFKLLNSFRFYKNEIDLPGVSKYELCLRKHLVLYLIPITLLVYCAICFIKMKRKYVKYQKLQPAQPLRQEDRNLENRYSAG